MRWLGTLSTKGRDVTLGQLLRNDVTSLKSRPRDGGGFRLEFEGPASPVLGQSIMTVNGPAGMHEIFVVPIAQDPTPAGYRTVHMPIHMVGIVAMGLWLIDNCQLEDLAAACERLGRWEFQFALAPIRFQGVTGSPVNPLAVF